MKIRQVDDEQLILRQGQCLCNDAFLTLSEIKGDCEWWIGKDVEETLTTSNGTGIFTTP